MKVNVIWLSILCVFFYVTASAQSSDSLKISLEDAEQLFVKNNMTLLAQKYNIDAAKAAIIQAKLLPNPVVNYEQTLNTKTTVANDVSIGAFGQHALQVQQLIQLAGKRQKLVNVAKISAEIPEYQFMEMVRELTYQLRTSFYAIHFLQKTLSTYGQEITTLNRLVTAYKEQVALGNVPAKEVIRLQSFMVTLETERSDILSQITDNQATFKILTGDASVVAIEPVLKEQDLVSKNIDALKLGELSDLALEQRFDRKIQEASVRLASATIELQKSLAKSDLTVGYSFDRAGSYLNNYHAITVSMPLAIFNKNQGNIKAAESTLQATRKNSEQLNVQISNEVLQAYLKAKDADRLYKAIDKDYLSNFDGLISGVIENYAKRNITLLEFTDFLESYKNTVSQINTLNNARIQTIENLNFVVGKKVL